MNLFIPHILATSADIDSAGNFISGVGDATANHGPLIVIFSVLLLLFIIVFIIFMEIMKKNIEKKIEKDGKNSESLEEFQKTIIDNALDEYKKKETISMSDILEGLKQVVESVSALKTSIEETHKPKEEKEGDYHKDIVGAYIDVNNVFKDAANELLGKIGCERVGIYVFHNGNKSYHGLPFFKMSCVHESTNSGTIVNNRRGKNHCDLPLHLYSEIIEVLWNTGSFISDDVNVDKDKIKSLKEFVEMSSIKSIYIKAIKDVNNMVAGFVVAEFNNVECFTTNSNRHNYVDDSIGTMVDTITPLITSKYVYKK